MAGDKKLYVAVARLELHIPGARSLKEKRSVVRSLVERLKSRHTVLVVEADGQSLHQRASLAVCAMSTDRVDLEARLQRVAGTIDENWDGMILSWDVETIQL